MKTISVEQRPALQAIARYEYGQESKALETVAQLVLDSHDAPDMKEELAAQLTALLASDATDAGKLFAAKQLHRIAGRKNVRALGRLLKEPKTAFYARYALEDIPGRAATKALCAAMKASSVSAKIGLINTLGNRRDPAAVTVLASMIGDDDPAIAEATIAALGKTGGAKAASVLKKSLSQADKSSPRAHYAVLADACLECAERLAAEGDKAEAVSLYRAVYETSASGPVKDAASRGMKLASSP